MRLRAHKEVSQIRYWPCCPICGDPVGCYGRGDGTWVNNERVEPPSGIWTFRCNKNQHEFSITDAQLRAGQRKGAGFRV